jgi:hypothetical protein
VFRSIIAVVYVVVGVYVANAHHYFAHLTTLPAVLSAVLAVVLWPLVVIGVDLHLK